MTAGTIQPAVQLDLSFEAAGGRTVLARRRVGYPFHVTAPLRSALPRAEVILQSVSGGLYGGDSLGQRIRAGPGAQAVLRMPSATTVHALRTGQAVRQSVALRADENASLFYLPRPLILFPGSALVQSMEIVPAGSATVMVRDGFLLHDPAGSPPGGRVLRSRLAVRDPAGRLIALDRMRIDDAMIRAGGPGVAGAFRAFGAVWLLRRLPPASFRDLKAAVARLFSDDAGCYASTTALRNDSGAVVRLAAIDGGGLDVALDAATNALASA
jgi:urease accessory protein